MQGSSCSIDTARMLASEAEQVRGVASCHKAGGAGCLALPTDLTIERVARKKACLAPSFAPALKRHAMSLLPIRARICSRFGCVRWGGKVGEQRVQARCVCSMFGGEGTGWAAGCTLCTSSAAGQNAPDPCRFLSLFRRALFLCRRPRLCRGRLCHCWGVAERHWPGMGRWTRRLCLP